MPIIIFLEEARKLRRLSILAGFDRKLTKVLKEAVIAVGLLKNIKFYVKSVRSSFSDAVAGLRRPLRLLSNEQRGSRDSLNPLNTVIQKR